jgi:hypothetical protein
MTAKRTDQAPSRQHEVGGGEGDLVWDGTEIRTIEFMEEFNNEF